MPIFVGICALSTPRMFATSSLHMRYPKARLYTNIQTTTSNADATSSSISQMLAAAQEQAAQDREIHSIASAAARDQAQADRLAHAEAFAQLPTTSADSLARFKTEASEQTDVLQRQLGELADAADDQQKSLEPNIGQGTDPRIGDNLGVTLRVQVTH